MKLRLSPAACLPTDHARATLLGRVWSRRHGGPVLVTVRDDAVVDLSCIAPTARDLLEYDAPVAAIRAARDLPRVAPLVDVLRAATPRGPPATGEAAPGRGPRAVRQTRRAFRATTFFAAQHPRAHRRGTRRP